MSLAADLPTPSYGPPPTPQVPICRGQWANHHHAFNLLFRIILPIFFFLFAALFTRVWPIKVLNHFERSTVGRVQEGRVQNT